MSGLFVTLQLSLSAPALFQNKSTWRSYDKTLIQYQKQCLHSPVFSLHSSLFFSVIFLSALFLFKHRFFLSNAQTFKLHLPPPLQLLSILILFQFSIILVFPQIITFPPCCLLPFVFPPSPIYSSLVLLASFF